MDQHFAQAWGLTLTQWSRLTDSERAHYRLNVSHAPFIKRYA